MPKLNDAQLVILSTAAGRESGSVLPLPKSLKAAEKTVAAMLKRMLKAGLVAEKVATRRTPVWRAVDGERLMLMITGAGLAALEGPEHEKTAPAAADTGGEDRRQPITAKPAGRRKPVSAGTGGCQ
jgi:hypothetical protein